MLKVLGNSDASLLSPEHNIEWIDLTGKELEIAAAENNGVHSITLNVKPQGTKKTATPLLTIATVALGEEVSAKYDEDEKLKPAIVGFIADRIGSKIDLISQMVELAEREQRTIDLTTHQSVDIKIAERVERNDADEVVSTAIVAEVDGQVFVYSVAGVFDPQPPQAPTETTEE